MDKDTKTNVLVGIFAVVVLAIFAYGAVRLGPGALRREQLKTMVIYVPSAAGLYKDSAVRIAGVQVGLIKEITLEGGHARIEVKLRQDVQLYPNASATVKTSGLLGDRYIEIDPGQPDPQARLERVGPPEAKDNPVIIYADEERGIESITQELGRTGKNLEAITDNLRAVLESRPGGNEDLARTLKAMARLTENLADITEENRKQFRETVAAFRDAAGSFERTLNNVEDISRKINEGEGTVGKLINDDTTINEINDAVKGINSFLGFAERLEIRIGYRAEVQPRIEDAKSVVTAEIWPRPDKFYFVNVISDPRGNRPKTSVFDITNTPAFGDYYPASVRHTVTSYNEQGLKFSAGIGKRFDYLTVFGGLIENSGGVGVSVSPDRYEHFDLEVTAYDFNRKGTDRPVLKARANLRFWDYFYLTGGVEDILAENSDDISPFFGGGIEFVDDDIKPLLSKAPL